MAALPDFEKEYRDDGLVSMNEISGTRIIKIATNDTFDFVRLRFEKLLGEEWVEMPLKDGNAKKKGVFSQPKNDENPKQLGFVRYENPRHKGVFIHLVLMDLPLAKKGYTAIITVVQRQ